MMRAVVHRIVHLSDIHLGATPSQESKILTPLVESLRAERAAWEGPPSLLAITGDLHDTAKTDVDVATKRLATLLSEVRGALGGDIPAVVVPGNHDRRTQGLLLPFEGALLDALAKEAIPRLVVGGRQLPFLAELLDDSFHGLPLAVGLVDSSYTPRGLVSAGGLLREEDLLELAQALSGRGDPHRPLLLLTHHHIIPTPVTDTARIDADTTNPVLRALAKDVLSRVISYADHEEWMMTALGAGSALSTLQSFGRPILVLHGHKHYPAVRVLQGSVHGQGDVVLLAGGSAGLALALDDGDEDDVARLWPSFHVLELEGADVRVRTIAYYDDAPRAKRDLLHISSRAAHWDVHTVSDRVAHGSAHLVWNRSDVTLCECTGRPGRWTLDAARSISGPSSLRYKEHLRAADGAVYVDASGRSSRVPASVTLPTDGTPFKYRLVGGAVRTVDEAVRVYGEIDPFEGVELLSRYESREARLTLRGLPLAVKPFGSAVDLTRGRAVPHPIQRHPDGAVEILLEHCPPRTELRIQWRPERR